MFMSQKKPSRAQVAEGALKQLKAELLTKNKTLVSLKHTLEEKDKELEQVKFGRSHWMKFCNENNKDRKIWKSLFFILAISEIGLAVYYKFFLLG